jgi:hypothetical protein
MGNITRYQRTKQVGGKSGGEIKRYRSIPCETFEAAWRGQIKDWKEVGKGIWEEFVEGCEVLNLCTHFARSRVASSRRFFVSIKGKGGRVNNRTRLRTGMTGLGTFV